MDPFAVKMKINLNILIADRTTLMVLEVVATMMTMSTSTIILMQAAMNKRVTRIVVTTAMWKKISHMPDTMRIVIH